MATFFPALNSVIKRMTGGEKRFARKLEQALEDDYLCWFDSPQGRQRRYPDFIVLHPGRGLLFLEVKDWKLNTIRTATHQHFALITHTGLQHVTNPLEQARQYTYTVVNRLQSDPQLQQSSGQYQGKLAFPYGFGVVFPNITRLQLQQSELDRLLPEHLVICKDEMAPSVDAEAFQERLWHMFNYRFGNRLTLPQIDRIRWHLFPEVRVEVSQQTLFDDDTPDVFIPDIIRVMDLQQEQLARSLGEGHRVIHGVAGSGKTMILGYRSLYLARLLNKPILVLCFNITLAAKLRSYTASKGVADKVQVYHFHDWCSLQLKTYHVDVKPGSEPFFERQVTAVIDAIENSCIPRAQYGAILIDEAHDFEPDWLKLITGMVDPETNSLLLLYDDAQSIYQRNGLGFTLSSVGIQARGRTTILKLNYRNTRQILQFAYDFAQNYLTEQETDEDHLPLVRPESGGNHGPHPELRQFNTKMDETRFIVRCLKNWHEKGRSWRDIAVVYRNRSIGSRVAAALTAADIPVTLTHDRAAKTAYDPEQDRVSLLTMHSSKGLEFATVIVAGAGELLTDEAGLAQEVRLLYIAMTRAMEQLLITTNGSNTLVDQLHKTAEEQLVGHA